MEKSSKELLQDLANRKNFKSTTDVMNGVKELYNVEISTVEKIAPEVTAWLFGYCLHHLGKFRRLIAF